MVDDSNDDSATLFGAGYLKIAERILRNSQVQTGDTVLDVGTGTGLLALTASSMVGSQGQVIGADIDTESVHCCQQRARQLGLQNVRFIQGPAQKLQLEDSSIDVIVCRSVLCHIMDKTAVAQEWYRVLKQCGRFSFFEPVDRYDTRLSELVDFASLGSIGARLKTAEEAIYTNPDDPLMNFDEKTLRGVFSTVGFSKIEHESIDRSREYEMTSAFARQWWHVDVGGISIPGRRSPYELLLRDLPREELDRCVDSFCSELDGRTITFNSKQLYMWGEK